MPRLKRSRPGLSPVYHFLTAPNSSPGLSPGYLLNPRGRLAIRDLVSCAHATPERGTVASERPFGRLRVVLSLSKDDDRRTAPKVRFRFEPKNAPFL